MVEGSGKAREIDLGEDFGDVVVKANGAQVKISADGSIHGLPAPANDTANPMHKSMRDLTDEGRRQLIGAVKSSGGQPFPLSAEQLVIVSEIAAEDVSQPIAINTPKIGDVALAGDHKGGIYGGILPSDNKPIWFLAAPKSMDYFNAASWATEQGGALPTRAQGDYLTTLKGKGGGFTELFNRGGSIPAGYVWLAEPYTYSRDLAWCQRLSYGDQHYYDGNRNFVLPVLCVRR